MILAISAQSLASIAGDIVHSSANDVACTREIWPNSGAWCTCLTSHIAPVFVGKHGSYEVVILFEGAESAVVDDLFVLAHLYAGDVDVSNFLDFCFLHGKAVADSISPYLRRLAMSNDQSMTVTRQRKAESNMA
jgi:hypothetical protein